MTNRGHKTYRKVLGTVVLLIGLGSISGCSPPKRVVEEPIGTKALPDSSRDRTDPFPRRDERIPMH
jgi:hypothetical protein